MLLCDINCDMGEGIGNDAAIMPFITSANIACGFHAGDEMSMNDTILLAKKYGVAVGAHPSFLDKENFGRTTIKLPVSDIYEMVQTQIKILDGLAEKCGVALQHVKPHGALYNMSAKDPSIATAIALAVKHYNPNLLLFGLSGSYSVKEARTLGLKTRSEVFADRTYQDDGSLTPRSQPNALIESANRSVEQVLQMIRQKSVNTLAGNTIPVVAETICIHGDGDHAVEFAKVINKALNRD